MPRKPIWTEGLLVSQHHFQQQDLYLEGLLSDRLRGVTHYDWGVTEVKIDERGFAAGQFRLQRFAAIWPDGASIACGEGTGVAAPAPRELPADAQRVDVYLGLAEISDAAQLSFDGSGARRYCREIQSATDTNSGGSAQEIEWARPNLQLFFGNERKDGFVTLRMDVSSSTTDMDIFATLRVFAPDGKEVTFIGAHEQTTMAKGWLSAQMC